MEHYDVYDGNTFICRCWYLGMAQVLKKDKPYLTIKRSVKNG